MSLPHILLGMLGKPQSGYDLKKEFGTSLQHFWHAELSQIYPTLKRLEQDGLVSSRIGETRAGPQRREYRRTAKGRRESLRWLRSGPVTGTEHIGYLAQVFFLAELGDDTAALEFLTALRDYMHARLATLESVEAEWRETDPRYPTISRPRTSIPSSRSRSDSRRCAQTSSGARNRSPASARACLACRFLQT